MLVSGDLASATAQSGLLEAQLVSWDKVQSAACGVTLQVTPLCVQIFPTTVLANEWQGKHA